VRQLVKGQQVSSGIEDSFLFLELFEEKIESAFLVLESCFLTQVNPPVRAPHELRHMQSSHPD
jgi:hypothetical protein